MASPSPAGAAAAAAASADARSLPQPIHAGAAAAAAAAAAGTAAADSPSQLPSQTSSPHPPAGSGPSSARHGELFVQTSSVYSPAWTASPTTPSNTPAVPGKRLRRRPTDNLGSGSAPGTPAIPPTPRRRRPKDRHLASLEAIRDFLRERSSYDVLPVSFRVVVLDTKLVVKPALDVLWQAGIISAPLWHSTVVSPPLGRDEEQQDGGASGGGHAGAAGDGTAVPVLPESKAAEAAAEGMRLPSSATEELPSSRIKPGFAGMLTVNDIIHLIQYYYKFHASYDIAAKDVEHFRLESLRDIEQALQVPQPPLLSIDPLRPLYQACQLLVKTHARRLPLLDYDETTGVETVVSVLTQYRVLKFIAMNCRETAGLQKSIHSCGIGTFTDTVNIATATLDTTVFDVVHIFSEKGISAVPILDEDGYVVDMYETVDVITLVRTGAYTALDLTIRQALERRPKDFPGVYTCSPQDSLANLFALLRKVRFHRLLVLETEDAEGLPPAAATGAASSGTGPEGEPVTGAGAEAGADAAAVAEEAEHRAATEQLAGATVVTTPSSATELLPDALSAAAGGGGVGALGRGLGLGGVGSGNPHMSASASRTSSGSKVSDRASAAAAAAGPAGLPQQGRTIEEELEAGLRTRRRGRLAGIVCLSDMLKYIVGGDDKDLGSALRQATA